MSVDWTKPIEAVHDDGAIVPVRLVEGNCFGGSNPDDHGDFWVNDFSGRFIHSNMVACRSTGETDIDEWSIRNVTQAEEPDNINSPSHYGAGSSIECIDAIRAALTPEEFRGYCKGNMLKYVWRERSKGGDESLQKAAKYAEFALEKADA